MKVLVDEGKRKIQKEAKERCMNATDDDGADDFEAKSTSNKGRKKGLGGVLPMEEGSPIPLLPSLAHIMDLEKYMPEMDTEVVGMLAFYYGRENFASIRKALLEPPSHTCIRVNTLKSDASALLKEVQELLQDYTQRVEELQLKSDLSSSLASIIPHRTPPTHSSYRFTYTQFGQSIPPPYLHPTFPLTRDTIIIPSIRRQKRGEKRNGHIATAIYPPQQAEKLEKKEEGEEEVSLTGKASIRVGSRLVIVDRICGEAVLRGADIFAKGIMCATTGLYTGCPVLIAIQLHKECVRASPWEDYKGKILMIGRGKAMMTRAEMFKAEKGLAVCVEEVVGWQSPPLNNLLPTHIYAQNLPSLVVGHIMSPPKGSTVMDLCACPGGKATHLVSLMEGKGLVVACDRTRKKVRELKHLSETMGMDECLVPLIMDSSHAVLPKEVREERHLLSSQPSALLSAAPRDKEGLHQIKGFYPETFDHVLLDPPCSALGLRPRFLIEASLTDLEAHTAFQKNFLWSAVLLLKPQGTLTYSTCTINPLENEGMVRYALDTYPCLQLIPTEPRLGNPGLAGLGLSDEERGMVQLFDPSTSCDNEQENGESPFLNSNGFFCAKFLKTTSLLPLSTSSTPASPAVSTS